MCLVLASCLQYQKNKFMKNNESVITVSTYKELFVLFSRLVANLESPVPDRKTFLLWVSNFRATGSALKSKLTGRLRSA